MTHKSRRVIITAHARADLIIHRKHIEVLSPDTARATIIDLVRKFHDIAAKGLTGSKRLWAPEHIRAFPYKKHCFYFRVDNGTLTLIRVTAHRQDVREMDFPASDESA